MIAVYHVDDTYTLQDNVGKKELKNIDKLLKDILGQDLSGAEDKVFKYKLENEENNLLVQYRDNFFKNRDEDGEKQLAEEFAKNLLESEMIEDGSRRHKRITEGLLFIRFINSKLIFLKLERINSLNRETYEIYPTFGLDKKYYKAAIYTGNNENIRTSINRVN